MNLKLQALQTIQNNQLSYQQNSVKDLQQKQEGMDKLIKYHNAQIGYSMTKKLKTDSLLQQSKDDI